MPLISIVLFLIFITFVASLFELLRKLALYFNPASVDVKDMSAMNATAPAAALEVVEKMRALGFTRVGEAALVHMTQPLIWYLVDPAGTTAAGVFSVHGQGHATIYSWFGEEACIVHSVPASGSMVRGDNFLYRPLTTSVENAYEQHRAALDDFTLRYGKPRRLNSMATLLDLDRMYNQRFARRRLLPDLIRTAVRTLAAGAIGVFILVTQYVS
jgi:hypothetical protein